MADAFIRKAFVLGAGLGERLRPLTLQLPKPLIPFFHEPLIARAFDHLRGSGLREAIVNTHHLPEAFAQAFPQQRCGDMPLSFRHEPLRLETAGGIANVRDWLGDESFVVYNGDVLATLPLEPLIQAHQQRGNLVTMALRSRGPALHVAWDQASGRVRDIRNRLGLGAALPQYLFTGIYACSPQIHEWIEPGRPQSVVEVFLEMMRQGAPVGGVLIDEGQWWDLGSREAYLAAHAQGLALGLNRLPAIHPQAFVEEGASLQGLNVLGPGSVVESGASLSDCLLWPGARVAAGARLQGCIVRSGQVAHGQAQAQDF
jgi:mannose-1-phosphate guanylyltransferase/mannose-1-phosphate guanylyltransferase/phosphomannomutase